MGKTAPPKKSKDATSVHSRAARRATSPGIDTDKSLKNIKPPAKTKTARPSVLAVHQGAGVTKKSKNGRKSILSARAKRRQEKELDRAEAVMDKKVNRIEKSKGKSRNVQERAKAWEDLNKKAKKAREEADALEKENWVDEEDEDNEMNEDIEIGDAPAAPFATETKAESIPLPQPAEDEDEVL